MASNTNEKKFEAILTELRALHAKVDQLMERLPAPEAQDFEIAARLFPALAGAVGSERFAASEALEYPAVRAVVNGMTPIAFGQLMGRVEQMVIGGYKIKRTTTGKKSTLWSIVAVIGE